MLSRAAAGPFLRRAFHSALPHPGAHDPAGRSQHMERDTGATSLPTGKTKADRLAADRLRGEVAPQGSPSSRASRPTPRAD